MEKLTLKKEKEKYDSDDAQNNPLDNGFLVEYISEEGGRYYMQTIGQSFRIGL
ncbi:TPA: hypothetical protein VDE21_000878 [Streptococcus pyogenes]|nr:hypothetical protein [Streptococcus pyogenes]